MTSASSGTSCWAGDEGPTRRLGDADALVAVHAGGGADPRRQDLGGPPQRDDPLAIHH
jgi:hypothetical protein